MGIKVHYEDNLFFIHSILRTLDSGLRLDIDPECFNDKILEEIFFINATLMKTFSSLKNSEFLINRSSHFRSLRRTVKAFTEFLGRLIEGELGFPDIVRSNHARLTSTFREHQRVVREIDAILDVFEPNDEATDVVSSQEYDFLLASDDERE